MWKMALEARERERELRREREGRMVAFTMDGEVSVYDTERLPDKSAESGEGGDSASREPSAHPNAEYPFPKMNTLPVSQAMTRVRSSTFGASGTSMDKPAGDVVMADAVAEISSRPSATGGPSIVVEDEAETRARKVARRRRAEVGVMKGLYEVGPADACHARCAHPALRSHTPICRMCSKISSPLARPTSGSHRSRSSPRRPRIHHLNTPTLALALSARRSTRSKSAAAPAGWRASSTYTTRRGMHGHRRCRPRSRWCARPSSGPRATPLYSLGVEAMTWFICPQWWRSWLIVHPLTVLAGYKGCIHFHSIQSATENIQPGRMRACR